MDLSRRGIETHGEANDDAAALWRVLRGRHSCRAFRADAVPRPVIERILAIAQCTPSWCNTQPWQLVVVSGAAASAFRAALLAHVGASEPAPDIEFPRAYQGVYQERRRACGLQLYDAVGVTRGDRVASGHQARENFRFYGAPHVAIVTTDAELGQYGAIDCGAYVSTFMLAAQAHGVACIAQAALASRAPFIREWLGIPDGRVVVCGISFGHEDVAHPANQFRTPRAAPGEAVEWRN
ncbi:nitroreductase [Paraburkholderia terrae]